MQVTHLWIVTKPTPRSTLEDICFLTDIPGLARQFLGGLHPEEIHGIYTDGEEALTAAVALLQPPQAQS